MNRAPEIYKIITNDWILISLEPKRKKEREWEWKSIWINNDWNFPKFGKKQDSKSLENSKQDKPKEIYFKMQYSQISEE